MARPTRLEFSAGTSKKFWQAATDGPTLTVTYGRIGTAGQTQVRTLATPAAARQEAAKLIAGKLEKGYTAATTTKTASPAKRAASTPPGSRPLVITKDRHGDLGAVWQDGKDLWFARVFSGQAGDELLRSGGTLADAIATEDGAGVERWRFASQAEAGRAAKWVVAHATANKLANDASADIRRWTRRVRDEQARIARLEVGNGPVTLTRDTTHPWFHARPPATSFESKRTMVPVFSLIGPLDPRLGARTGIYASVCPQALLDPYMNHVWEVVVQDPAKPSTVDAYFESARGFWTIHLSLQIDTVDESTRWAVVEHSGDRGSPGWLRTQHLKSRAEAEKLLRERSRELTNRYKRVAQLGPYHAKLLAEITRHHRVPGQKPATIKLRPAHAAMVQSVDAPYATPSGNVITRDKVVGLGGVPRFCQEDWDFLPHNPCGKGKLLTIATIERACGPQWSNVLNDGDAGTFNVYAAPGEPFGTVSFSCG